MHRETKKAEDFVVCRKHKALLRWVLFSEIGPRTGKRSCSRGDGLYKFIPSACRQACRTQRVRNLRSCMSTLLCSRPSRRIPPDSCPSGGDEPAPTAHDGSTSEAEGKAVLHHLMVMKMASILTRSNPGYPYIFRDHHNIPT